jgi:HAD superfamily hydrolase (TIGR01484 family)|tara:strand:- start:24498 stop:25301 length:804 start_codon:yes stop_codon:yes gene_type:complete
VRTLDACPKPALLLSFDFDGTLHDPADKPPVPTDFFTTIRRLRETKGAVWGINTGRSMPQVMEGFIESSFPFLPDWVIAREREIYFPNAFGRFLAHKDWNDRCEKDIAKLFKKSKKTLKKVRYEIEEHTGAQYIEMKGEPAGLISRTEEEMEWIAAHIAPLMAEVPGLGWQRNSIYLRFGHKDYQKGSTLTEMARLYDIPTSHVFAMGDSHNDIEMLSEAHSGGAACPANAVEAIRQIITERGGLVASKNAGHGVVEALQTIFPDNV